MTAVSQEPGNICHFICIWKDEMGALTSPLAFMCLFLKGIVYYLRNIILLLANSAVKQTDFCPLWSVIVSFV